MFILKPELQELIDLNKFIHNHRDTFNYHMEHIKLVQKYALIINKNVGSSDMIYKLSYASLAHDLLKEKGLNVKEDGLIKWNGIDIPQDLNRYVRTNLDILSEFGLDDYFNSSIQYHALAAGIFVYKELHIDDPEILYPIFFHSCPIIPVYEKLSDRIKTLVDIIMLSDKLSSNYLRINMRESEVRIDLDATVFGYNGKEFNYSLGLLMARIISQGKSEETQAAKSTNYYYERLCEINPLLPKEINIKMIGGNKKWPKRKSLVLKTQ